MTEPAPEPIRLNLTYRSYLLCAGMSVFLAANVLVLTLGPPLWLWAYAALMIPYLGASLLSFHLFGRRWTRTPDEFIIPTLREPQRRYDISERGIGVQRVPFGTTLIYLGDPWERGTDRFTPNLCMSPTDIREWLPAHHTVRATRRRTGPWSEEASDD